MPPSPPTHTHILLYLAYAEGVGREGGSGPGWGCPFNPHS